MTYAFPSHTNPNDTFWLARYAHNTLAPLIEAAKQYEPSISLHIELTFDIERSYRAAGSFLTVRAHWDRKQPLMLLRTSDLTTKEGVDKVAAEVQKFIDTEQAALEAAHDAAAEASLPIAA